MRMTLRSIYVFVVFLAITGSGCATKKYVRNRVDERVSPTEHRVGELGELEETSRRNTQETAQTRARLEQLEQSNQRLSAQVDELQQIRVIPRIPEFPWPPPNASASIDIPRDLLQNPRGQNTLKDVSDKLNRTLRQTGYIERSWYSVPNGFALITRLEQFQSDGAPLSGDARWSVKIVPQSPGSLIEYAMALVRAKPGFYRVIA